MVVKINELPSNNPSENSTVVIPLDNNSIQPISLDSNNPETVKKDSVIQLDDTSSAVRTGNNQESFTRIPGWSFMSNSLFTNLLRAKEAEETPVLHYESTRADKMRSRKLYRQMNKQSNTILSEQINGYCGDKPINDIVEYIEGIKSSAVKKKAKKGTEIKGEKNVENKGTSSKKHANLKSGSKSDKNKATESVKVINSKNNSAKLAPTQEKRRIESVNKENNSVELKHDKRTPSKNDSEGEMTKFPVHKKDNTTSKSKTENDGFLPKQSKMKNNYKSSIKQGETLKAIVETKTNSSAGDNNEQNKENKAKENDKVYQASKVKKAKNANK